MAILGLLASVGIGLSLGLVGAGGSILTVPILVYLLGISPHDAVGVSLAVVATTSLVGAGLQRHAGLVDLRAAALFGLLGMAGAALGSRLTHLISERHLMLAFGAVMVAAAAAMLFGRALPRKAAPSALKAGLAALATGTLTGFLGVGGGFLVVPALLFFGGLAPRVAMGTSLAVIAANSLVGLGAALHRSSLDWVLAATVSLASVAGMSLGAALSRRLSPETLRRGFAMVSLAVAAYVLVRTVAAPGPAPEPPPAPPSVRADSANQSQSQWLGRGAASKGGGLRWQVR